jgi:hypothetical protein
MRSNLGLRAALALMVLASALVVTVVAQAHSCSPSADPPVDIGNSVRAHGEIDCTSALADDVLTVKLWRRCTGCPDDFWGQTQDGFPPNQSGAVYSATVTACEAEDPPDDFKTETRGNSSLHGASADAISAGSNLNC